MLPGSSGLGVQRRWTGKEGSGAPVVHLLGIFANPGMEGLVEAGSPLQLLQHLS
jgi:hypothetical protein